MTINRRGFIGGFAAVAASAAAADAQPGAEAKTPVKPAAEESKPGKRTAARRYEPPEAK